MKEGFVRKDVSGSPDMEKINRYTRRPYSPEEVYTLSLVLPGSVGGLAGLVPGEDLPV